VIQKKDLFILVNQFEQESHIIWRKILECFL